MSYRVEGHKLWTIIGRRFRQNKRGASTVIAVVLSLVIIVVIVSNVVLWSYEMNQLDWEKMNEDITITDVTRVTNSSWFVAQSEYTVNKGSLISGTYTDTQATDGSYERFRETLPFLDLWVNVNDESKTDWTRVGANPYLDAIDYNANYVYTDQNNYLVGDFDFEDTSETGTIDSVEVEVYAKSTNNPLDIWIWDGSAWQLGGSVTIGTEWAWYSVDVSSILNTREKINGARMYLTTASAGLFEVDAGRLHVSYARLDMNGTFVIDMSTYPIANIQTVEIQLRYRADDADEKWYLKAYNWTGTEYSDNGFNSTAGHTPTTGWDYYAVNLTDQWNSYVQNDGTMHIQIVDEGADATQTTIDIDFLGVRVKIDGTRFTFKNEGSVTLHMVSLWIINSTLHQHYDIDVIVNSAETYPYIRADISLASGSYTVKVVTKRGNKAVYSVEA